MSFVIIQKHVQKPQITFARGSFPPACLDCELPHAAMSTSGALLDCSGCASGDTLAASTFVAAASRSKRAARSLRLSLAGSKYAVEDLADDCRPCDEQLTLLSKHGSPDAPTRLLVGARNHTMDGASADVRTSSPRRIVALTCCPTWPRCPPPTSTSRNGHQPSGCDRRKSPAVCQTRPSSAQQIQSRSQG